MRAFVRETVPASAMSTKKDSAPPGTLGHMRIADLRTPAALVDLEKTERNASQMSERATLLGARLRPHVKTHKTLEAARIQVRGQFGGIAVSTMAEAAFFTDGGFRDITYAVPVAPVRLAEAAALARRLDRFAILLDDPAVADAAEACARDCSVRLGVFLKVDCGARRAGVDPELEEGVALAGRLASSPHLDFRGILTHAGQSYRGRNAAEIRTVAAAERDVMTGFAARVRRAGVPVGEVSIGSTPTLSVANDLAGVTEVRPGNYIFFDATQVAIGACTLEDVAFSVLVRVIGRYPRRRELVVDGGALALSKDPGPVHVDPECGYGLVLDASGGPRHGLRVVSLSQEHGVVRSARDLAPGELPIGSLLRIVPNHSCLAAALFDRYAVVRGPDAVIAEWRPVRGW
jgi:D-serine deaminase-like pyridoxal phosphate-dependent protein